MLAEPIDLLREPLAECRRRRRQHERQLGIEIRGSGVEVRRAEERQGRGRRRGGTDPDAWAFIMPRRVVSGGA